MIRNLFFLISFLCILFSSFTACGTESDLSQEDDDSSRGATSGGSGDDDSSDGDTSDGDGSAGGSGDDDGDDTDDDGDTGAGGSAPDEITCPDSYAICDEQCSPLQIDPLNCGECGQVCGEFEACLGGLCRNFGCDTGQVTCDDACVNLSNDRQNCGECGFTCASGQLCVEGSCLASCADGLLACGNACVNPLSDPIYCGVSSCGSDTTESPSNPSCTADEICVAGVCRQFEPQWTVGQAINNADNASREREMSIGSDAAGNAVAVWREQLTEGDPTSIRLFARSYDVATRTWGNQEQISESEGSVRTPKIVVNAAGVAFAFWVKEVLVSTTPDVKEFSIVGARYTPESGWEAAFSVSTNTSPNEITYPDAVIAETGEVHVFWPQIASAESVSRIHTRIISASSLALQAEQVFDDVNQADFNSLIPVAAVNASGIVALSFLHVGAPGFPQEVYLYAAVYNRISATWSQPENVSAEYVYNPGVPTQNITVDQEGKVSVFWTAFSSSNAPLDFFQLYMADYDGAWGSKLRITPTDIEQAGNFAAMPSNPTVSSDPSGLTTLVYTVADYLGGNLTSAEVRAMQINDGAVVDEFTIAPGQPTFDRLGDSLSLTVVSDGMGGATVLWVPNNDNILTSRFVPSETSTGFWTVSEAINQPGLGLSSSPALTTSASKRTYSLWLQDITGADPTESIFFASFD